MANLYILLLAVWKCCCYLLFYCSYDFAWLSQLRFASFVSYRNVLHMFVSILLPLRRGYVQHSFSCQNIASFDCLMFCARLRSHTFSCYMAANPRPVKYPPHSFRLCISQRIIHDSHFRNAWWPGKYQNKTRQQQQQQLYVEPSTTEENKMHNKNIKEHSQLSWIQLRCINCVQLIRTRMWFGASTVHCIVCWHFVALY